MLIVLILFSVTLAAIAQLALKHGMNLVNDELAPQTFSLNGRLAARGRRAAVRLGRAVPVRPVRARVAGRALEGVALVPPTRSRRSRTC